MPSPSLPPNVDPLDLLRRSVLTPLKAFYRMGAVHLRIETNDLGLVPTLMLGADDHASAGWEWEWKIVRDPDAPGPLLAPRFLQTEVLSLVEMGIGCLIGVDHERRELLAFVGRDVDSPTYQHVLVPFFCQLITERSGIGQSAIDQEARAIVGEAAVSHD
jgi:hypothetical protein